MLATLALLAAHYSLFGHVPTAMELFTHKGTTCQNMTDAVRQIGCLSSSGQVASGAIATKFVSYDGKWDGTSTLVPSSAKPYYQTSCDLPVVLDTTVKVDSVKFRRLTRTNRLLTTSRLIEWAYGTVPANYALISTFFASASALTADGSAYDPTNPMSVPREIYINVVFDTSAVASAFIRWKAANDFTYGANYEGVDQNIYGAIGPDTWSVVSGMCAREVDALVRGNVDPYMTYGSVTKSSGAIPLRPFPSTSFVDTSAASVANQIKPFDGWKDTIAQVVLPYTQMRTFADTCKSQVQALKIQCAPPRSSSNASLASTYVTNFGTAAYSYQTLSCKLPVVVSARYPLDQAKLETLLKLDLATQARVFSGYAFEWALVPTRNGLVSSTITSTSGWGAAKGKGSELPTEVDTTLSFHDSTAAYSWLSWFASYYFLHGQKTSGKDYDPSLPFDPRARIVVHGMCSDAVVAAKTMLNKYAKHVDFAYGMTSSVVRPTGDYAVKPDKWN